MPLAPRAILNRLLKRDVIARLERRLGAVEQRLATLKQRLQEAHVTIDRWKRRAAEVTARVEGLEDQLRVSKSEVSRARRETPPVSAYQQMFAHRWRTLSARIDRGTAAARDASFRAVSTPYRHALEQTPDALSPYAHRMTLDGLAWWFPYRIGKSGVTQAWIDKQRFPYHGILMTHVGAAGGIMLDLGANIGRMSIARVVLGEVTAAYCAEPDPISYACLARNVIDNQLHGLVMPDQTAIGDRDGVIRLLRDGPSGHFRVLPDGGPEVANTVVVPVTTLDTWVTRLGIDLEAVTFIKVDVEGFERRLVAGASRVLSHRHISWQIEIYPDALRKAGDDPPALYDELARAFTHFIDLNRNATGHVVRPVGELPDALRYIDPDGKTDLLLFSAGSDL